MLCFSWIAFMWIFKAPDWVKDLPQGSQLYFLYPSWIFLICSLRLPDLAKSFPQNMQLWFLIFGLVCKWIIISCSILTKLHWKVVSNMFCKYFLDSILIMNYERSYKNCWESMCLLLIRLFCLKYTRFFFWWKSVKISHIWLFCWWVVGSFIICVNNFKKVYQAVNKPSNSDSTGVPIIPRISIFWNWKKCILNIFEAIFQCSFWFWTHFFK